MVEVVVSQLADQALDSLLVAGPDDALPEELDQPGAVRGRLAVLKNFLVRRVE